MLINFFMILLIWLKSIDDWRLADECCAKHESRVVVVLRLIEGDRVKIMMIVVGIYLYVYHFRLTAARTIFLGGLYCADNEVAELAPILGFEERVVELVAYKG